MYKSRHGFTIVELLIVIVVIAILATITITSYKGITSRADTVSRISETRSWSDLIEIYIANEGKLPIPSSGVVIDTGSNEATYCLGTGFQDTDYRSGGYNTGSCRTMYPCGGSTTCANDYQRGHVEPNLNTELAKYGKLPSGPRSCPAGECSMGPYVNFYSSSSMTLANYFPATSCPSGFQEFDRYPAAPNTKIVGCQQQIDL